MTTNKYIILDDVAFFEIKGNDKELFLQGLITNDIFQCTENASIYSAFLSPQGKFIADFFILNLGQSYLFETKKKFIDSLIIKFNFYKLRADIKINKIDNLYSILIHERNNLFNNLKEKGDTEKINNGHIIVDPRNKLMGLKAFIKKETLESFVIKYSLSKDEYENYDKKRINHIIPDSILDLKINKSILLENNFDSINAISWNKGCYVGQEITARMKYRALIKKSIMKISLVKGKIKTDDEIFFKNKKIGYMCSVDEDIGLAMLNIIDAKNSSEENQILDTKDGKIKVHI